MSGTSLDGLDISYCTYSRSAENQWSYTLHCFRTIRFPDELYIRLKEATRLSGEELSILDLDLGKFYADCTNYFIETNSIDRKDILCVSSHGYTVFHQPDIGLTLQIGCGERISAGCQLPVINDFRTKDVLNGGQGAPLVPIGDLLLFNKQADHFINIGGFVNICSLGDKICAFDICPGNLPLNFFASKLGADYDPDGNMARLGTVNKKVLDQLLNLPYFHQSPPKSLGTEWLEKEFMPIVVNCETPQDSLRTVVELISHCIANTLPSSGKVWITGGGAFNTFLIELIRSKSRCEIVLPEPAIINFKEAIIFGFMAALKLEGEVNCLSSVTGARQDVCGGVLHHPY